MAVISFYSNEKKETGQTMSLAAITTQMAIDHNYKILIISTEFNDLVLENCFWEYEKIRAKNVIDKSENASAGLDSDIEGLIKVLNSNRSSTEIIKNYARTILKERLDILVSPATTDYNEYKEIAGYYSNIISLANRYYDFVFVDISKKLPKEEKESILQISDLVVINLTQRLKTLNDFIELQSQNEFYRRKNVMLLIGKYDRDSKYNKKNLTRYLKEKKEVSVVPYSMLLLENCDEGKAIDYIWGLKGIKDELDTNKIFLKEVSETTGKIISKLQELQMRI